MGGEERAGPDGSGTGPGGRPAQAEDLARYAGHRQDEIDGAAVYEAMARAESDPGLAEVYERLAAVERRHAAFWAERIEQAGGTPPVVRPSWRARVLAWLAARGGAGLVAPVMADAEHRDRSMYDDQPEAAGTSLPADERSHARVLAAVVRSTGGLQGPSLARLEGRHRGVVSGNALRAGVLGANDGLVSNLSLVMGVAGASATNEPIVVAGVAGLLAGAISMALGEWISVQTSREAAGRQLRVERAELEAFPEEEREELRLIYQSKGLPPDEAAEITDRLFAGDRETVLDVLAREELGLDPDELGGSPWAAAGASFVLFAVGALVPLLPFLLRSGGAAIAAALALSGIALFVLGAGLTVLTGRGALLAGLRQLGVGLGAAAVTYGAGSLVGLAL